MAVGPFDLCRRLCDVEQSRKSTLQDNTNQLTASAKKFAILDMHTARPRLGLEDWQRLKIQVFWCYDGRPPNVQGRSRYRTPNYSCWLVRRGRVTLYNQGQTWEIGPGEWGIAPPPGYERSMPDDVELLSIHFRLAWAEGSDVFKLPGGPVFFPATRRPALARAVEAVHRFAASHSREDGLFKLIDLPLDLAEYLHFQTLAGQFALELLGALHAEGRLPEGCCQRPDPQLQLILERLRDLPLDYRWDSAILARSLHMSAGHLNRVFRREHGQTPRQYFDTRRLEHAKSAIVTSRASVKEVAAGLGFSSAVFCRWFRQATGASPSLYRRHGPGGTN